MARRVIATLVAIFVVAVLAQPAGAQYAPEGGFTVSPNPVIAGQTVTISGQCLVNSAVTVQLDNGPIIATGTVPIPPGYPPNTQWQSPPGHTPAWMITNTITMTGTIPPGTTPGPHTLTVRCHGQVIQVLTITVLAAVCDTKSGSDATYSGAIIGGIDPYGTYAGDYLAVPATTAAPNTSPTANEITGVVTSSVNGLPMKGATIAVLRTNGTSVSSQTTTDGNGFYRYGNLAPGTYRVQVSELGFVQYISAPLTFVSASFPITQNVTMTPAVNAPGVAGYVLDSATGQKLQDVIVRLWAYPTINRYIQTVTNANGQYVLSGVPTGTYQIYFTAMGYNSIWYSASATRGGATVFTVPPTGTITVNALLGNLVGGGCKSNPPSTYSGGRSSSTSFGGSPVPPALSGGAALLATGGLVLLRERRKRRALARPAGSPSASSGARPGASRPNGSRPGSARPSSTRPEPRTVARSSAELLSLDHLDLGSPTEVADDRPTWPPAD